MTITPFFVTANEVFESAQRFGKKANDINGALDGISEANQQKFFRWLDENSARLSPDAKELVAKNVSGYHKAELWQQLGSPSDMAQMHDQLEARTMHKDFTKATTQIAKSLETIAKSLPEENECKATKNESLLATKNLIMSHIDAHIENLDDPNALNEMLENIGAEFKQNKHGLFSKEALNTVLKEMNNAAPKLKQLQELLVFNRSLFSSISGDTENGVEVARYINFTELPVEPAEVAKLAEKMEPANKAAAHEKISDLLNNFASKFINKDGEITKFNQLSKADQAKYIQELETQINKELNKQEKALLKLESEKALKILNAQKPNSSFGQILNQLNLKSVLAYGTLATMAGAVLGPLGFLAVGAISLLGTGNKKQAPEAKNIVEFDNSNTQSSQGEDAQKLAP